MGEECSVPCLGWFSVSNCRSRPVQPLKKGAPVTKDTFLTVRWNNLLMFGLGIPTLILVVVAFSTSSWSERGALIALSVLGGFF
jgi:hypothetical protein